MRILCKECKHWAGVPDRNGYYGECSLKPPGRVVDDVSRKFSSATQVITNANGYCERGLLTKETANEG